VARIKVAALKEITMSRIQTLWSVLLLVYASFWMWHTPLQPALTAEEVAQHMADGGLDQALPAGMHDFLANDDGRSFFMVNIMQFRETALYPDGAFPEITSAKDAAQRYANGVIPLLLLRGSYPIFSGTRHVTMLDTMSPDAEAFEDFAVVRYRSRRDFLDMVLSEGFNDVVVHKWASLEGTIVVPSRRSLGFDLGLLVPLVLLVFGTLGSLILGRSAYRPDFA
jgi:hypothetical protein